MAGGVITLTFDAKLKGAVENFIKVAEKVKDVDGGMKRLTASVNSAGRTMNNTAKAGESSFVKLAGSIMGGVTAANMLQKAIGLVTSAWREAQDQQRQSLALAEQMYYAVSELAQIVPPGESGKPIYETAKRASRYGLLPVEALKLATQATQIGVTPEEVEYFAKSKKLFSTPQLPLEFLGKMRAGFPEQKFTAAQSNAMLMAAAGKSRATATELAQFAGGPMALTQEIGGTPEELLALIGMETAVFSPQSASEYLGAFTVSVQRAIGGQAQKSQKKAMKDAGITAEMLKSAGLFGNIEMMARLTDQQLYDIYGFDTQARKFFRQAVNKMEYVKGMAGEIEKARATGEEYNKMALAEADRSFPQLQSQLDVWAATAQKQFAEYEKVTPGAAARATTIAKEQSIATEAEEPYLAQGARTGALKVGEQIAPIITRDITAQKGITKAAGEMPSLLLRFLMPWRGSHRKGLVGAFDTLPVRSEAENAAVSMSSDFDTELLAAIEREGAMRGESQEIMDRRMTRARASLQYYRGYAPGPEKARRVIEETRNIVSAYGGGNENIVNPELTALQSAASELNSAAQNLKHSQDPAKRSTGGVE